MTTIIEISEGHFITNSRADINQNFANLNAGKIETSDIDTDTALANNSDLKVPSQKATKAYVDANVGLRVSSELTVGTTHSLTTTTGERVAVWARGATDGTAGTTLTLTLKYNGVTKDTLTSGDHSSIPTPFSLMYTETPGVGTANITVEKSAGTFLGNVVIMVMKFPV
jgi:hypothetical protein